MHHGEKTHRFSWKILIVGLAVIGPPAYAADRFSPLITQAIDDNALVTLGGNTRPEAIPANDRGAVSDTLSLNHMMLQLRRLPEQEAALDRLIEAQQDPVSPYYRHWLDAAQIGTEYGLAASDMAKLTGWLERHGFRVNFVYANGLVIDFSGTAGQVREAFHTQLHRLDVDGQPHLANFSDPQIPAAFARRATRPKAKPLRIPVFSTT
jgi:hypothetical protein